MLKLAYKCSILGMVLLVLSILGNNLIGLPYYWGNSQLTEKSLYLKEQTSPPKAYFIGSSITYHAAIPSIFCELTNKPKDYAFNLGIDGAQPPQTFYILEELLATNNAIEYIFFEMNSFDQMADHLFQTTRSKYYYQLTHLWASIKYFIYSNYLENADLRITHKLGLIAKHGVTFFESLFKIGMRKEMILAMVDTKSKKQSPSTKNYGYYGLTAHKEEQQVATGQLKNQLKEIKEDFITAYSKPANSTTYNPILQEMFVELIQKAKAKNIQLVYLLTPFKCSFDSAPEMLTLFQSLPAANKIDLADPNKYPALYEVANRWDIGHFNDAGAKLYTQKLSELTNQLPE